jgi:hypothetical protein
MSGWFSINRASLAFGGALGSVHYAGSAVRPYGRGHRASVDAAGARLQLWPGRCRWTARGPACVTRRPWPRACRPCSMAPRGCLRAAHGGPAALARLPSCMPTQAGAATDAVWSTGRSLALHSLVPTSYRTSVTITRLDADPATVAQQRVSASLFR